MSEEQQEQKEQQMLDQLTAEEQQELANYLQGAGSAPTPQENYNAHKFISDVAISKDTTKTGNLDAEEIGTPKLPLRTLKELEVFSRDIADEQYFADYFKKIGEIQTSTSLSKFAKLLDLAVVSRREMADVTKQKPVRENKGWFKKKKTNEASQE